jgi:hypothetical protein
MKNIHPVILIYLFVNLMTGCYSLGTFQSARTLGKGYEERGLGLSVLNIPSVEDSTIATSFAPSIEFFGGLGLGSKTDLRYRFSGIYGALELKQQISGNQSSKFASSLSIGGGSSISLIFSDVFSTLYFSYKPKSFVELTINPKYSYNWIKGSENSAQVHLLGGNAGVLFGNKIQLGITAGYFDLVRYDIAGTPYQRPGIGVWNVGLGLKINFLSNFLSP